VALSELAARMQRMIGMPVWGETGLTGKYDFAFQYAQDPAAEFSPRVSALPTALGESLGLRLNRRKRPVESLVTDPIAAPSEN
jgi:uncharacterized protein (TIGR03435 family)